MQVLSCIMDVVVGELGAVSRGAASLDAVFKALADPTRRAVLDSLRRRSGQTLGELCGQLAMARQSASQHLAVLAGANLISTVRQGRESCTTSIRYPSTRSRSAGSPRSNRPLLETLAPSNDERRTT